ncbi:hypothetical protein GCM10029976_044120 [Kribbella albertanoniae]|uniref:DUF3592 domain-containing protein n=1 Tax=Kribbella albertanoniae TaxID=1266829 RepID=A0A4R4PMU0_9ACTN|nr:DUF3592 domain-containing protein [Kribbella albertanoniae]TDC23442.1 hypothetical protein E1261_28465 [Kribbella albertanoniae]
MKAESRRRWLLEGIGGFVGAVVVAFIGYVQVEDLYWLRHRGEVATGIVVDRKVGGRDSWIEVRYTTKAGRTVTEMTSNFEGEPAVGAPIEVVYDPEEPDRMQAENWGLGYGFPVVFFPLATIGFVVAGTWFLREWGSAEAEDTSYPA